MRVYVTDKEVNDISLEELVIPINQFNSKACQPFIATGRFECIVIDVDKKIDLGILSNVCKRHLVVPKIIDDIDSYTISFLSTVYREKSAKLRYTYMRNKDNIQELIDELSIEYQWNSYIK